MCVCVLSMGSTEPPLTRLQLVGARLQLCEAYLLAALLMPSAGLLRVDLTWNMWGQRGEKVVAAALLDGPCKRGLRPAYVKGLEEMDVRRKEALQARLKHRQFTKAEVEQQRKAAREAKEEVPLRTQAMRGPRDVEDHIIPIYLRSF